jgi:hypothetical protein
VVTHNEKEKWECRDATTLLHVVSLVNTIFACDPLFVLFFPHPWSLIQPLFFGVSIFFFIFCRGCVGCFTLSYSLCTIGAHLSSQLLSSQVVYTHTHTQAYIYMHIHKRTVFDATQEKLHSVTVALQCFRHHPTLEGLFFSPSPPSASTS